MKDGQANRALERTIRLYPWYALTFNAYFWMPVFVLYFLQHMPLADVLRLEAVYYLAVVVLEVPSGYFSDRIGRRPTLLLACAFLVAAYAAFAVGSTFEVFAAAQILLAGGIAFNSGADTSLHYDALASLGRDSEYGDREAIVARNALFASALGGLLGGLAGLIDLRLAYVLSAAAAVASLLIVAAMCEPAVHERTLIPPGPVRQARMCIGLLRNPLLAWTFAYASIMTVLNHVPYEFYQPYIQLAFTDDATLRDRSPIIAGIHMGAAMLLASGVAAWSIRLRDRFGYVRLLLAGAGLQTLIIAAMGAVLHPVILILVLLRSFPRALAAAPVNAAIAPCVDRAQRATYLSLQSLTGRLAFSGALLALSFVGSDGEGALSWQTVSTRLLSAATFGALAVLVMRVVAVRQASSLASA